MEQNKDDWNKLMESLELDDLQKEVRNIATKYSFNVQEEKSKEEGEGNPITPDYKNKVNNYLNVEEYIPLKKCQNCEEVFQHKKHTCKHVEFELEMFTRAEDLIDEEPEPVPGVEQQPEPGAEQQPEPVLVPGVEQAPEPVLGLEQHPAPELVTVPESQLEDELQNLFEQIESLEFLQNEINSPTSNENIEPPSQTPLVENEIEVIDLDLENMIIEEIIEIPNLIDIAEEEIIEISIQEDIVEVTNEIVPEAIELVPEANEIVPEANEIVHEANEIAPEGNEIQEILTRQESKDERRRREFKNISSYYLRKIEENPKFEIKKFRKMIYCENGGLKYQKIYGPPIPTSQMIRQLYDEEENEFKINNQDLEIFLKKFSDRVFRFLLKYPEIKGQFRSCRCKDIAKTRKTFLAIIYAIYHSIYNLNSSTIAPEFPENADVFNYRFWDQYKEKFLNYIPGPIRYQFIIEEQFDPNKREKRHSSGQSSEEPSRKIVKRS